MRFSIDTDSRTLVHEVDGETRSYDLFSRRSFEILSREWIRVGWNQKYTYTFSWFGRPIIQLPEDLIRVQEVIYRLKPDVVIETGVAHGGSLMFYASLFKAMGKGRVIGVDIDIRPHNRRAIEAHELSPLITLVDGSSTDSATLSRIREVVGSAESCMVILDSNHSRKHVADELRLYSEFVSPGAYLVVTDGVMEDLAGVPRGSPEWVQDNPAAAAREFLESRPDFVLDVPEWPFNESELRSNVTHWPFAWLRRV